MEKGETYYIFARSKANDTHNAGTPSAGLEITTGRDPLTNHRAFNKFPAAQVRDCQRDPPFPIDGLNMRLWSFRTPAGVTDTQANTPGAYFQLREAANYSESNKNFVLDLYNADGTLLRGEVTRGGKIHMFFDEGFLYISSGASGFGYVFFYEPPASNSITVTSFEMP